MLGASATDHPESTESNFQKVVPVNVHREACLLRVPKFLAEHWRKHKEGTVVGILLNSVDEENGEVKGNSLHDWAQWEVGQKKMIIIASSESIPMNSASQKSQTTVGQAELKKLEALKKMKSYQCNLTRSDHLYLLSVRGSPQDTDLRDSELLLNTPTDPVLLSRHEKALFGYQGYNETFRKQNHNISSAVTKGISFEAKINMSITMVPALTSIYHDLLKSRQEQFLALSRTTKETELMTANSMGLDGNIEHNRLHLFKYYNGNNGMAFTLSSSGKRMNEQKIRKEFGSNSALQESRDDEAKQRIFQAFEARENADNASGLTMQDILKVTQESQHYIKSIIEQIAVPVRTGERKRVLYQLKPEYSHKRHRMQ